MSSFQIVPMDIGHQREKILDAKSSGLSIVISLQEISYRLSCHGGSAKNQVVRTLNRYIKDISNWSVSVEKVAASLETIMGLYRQTENDIASNIPVVVSNVTKLRVETATTNKDGFVWKEFVNAISDGFVEESVWNLIAGILEGAGSAAVLIQMLTARAFMPGPQGFYMYNSNVLPFTSWLSRISPMLATAGKYGIPILGGIIDFFAQRANGEEALHAGIKAIVHTGVGVGVGAAVGAIVGSIIPVAGTAAGAAIGMAIGLVVEVGISAIFTVGINSGLDYLYDNYVRGTVDRVVEGVREGIDNVKQGVRNFVHDVGQGITSLFATSGRMLGTIFG